jgi:hypothetical protein
MTITSRKGQKGTEALRPEGQEDLSLQIWSPHPQFRMEMTTKKFQY